MQGSQKTGMSRTSKIVSIIIGIVIFFAGVFYLVMVLTGDLTKAADSFFTQIAEGNARAAYDNSAEGLKSENSFEEFQGFVNEMELAAFQSSKWTQRNIENNRGELQGTLSFSDGQTVPTRVELVKEKGAWKVLSFELNAGGFTNTKQQVQAAVPSLGEAQELVQNTMYSFMQAYEKGDYADFHKGISKEWQGQVTPTDFNEAFKNVKINSTAQKLKNVFLMIDSDTPYIDESGVLIIKGNYVRAFGFTLKYVEEDSKWKLYGIQID